MYGLDAVSSLAYMASNGKMTDDFERIWKEEFIS
jgi:hypothetical protein